LSETDLAPSPTPADARAMRKGDQGIIERKVLGAA
jgi:hypothetical protein